MRPAAVMRRFALAPFVLVLAPLAEPAPRSLGAPVGRYDGDFAALSAARELRDGRVLVSDFRDPSLLLVDLRTGAASKLGSKGRGPNEYLQPGGMYGGGGDTTFVIDRGQPRLLVISDDGRIVATRSIELRGTSSASDNDVDLQRVDALGHAYLVASRTPGPDSASLIRLDVPSQRSDQVARLRRQTSKVVRAEGAMTISRTVIFSPADDWGVASDGSVAIVRADPYRVDWIGPDGSVTQGPVIAHDVVPVTGADREAFAKRHGGESMRIGMSKDGRAQQGTTVSGDAPEFARVKPPFSAGAVIVSPEGRVWVLREAPQGITSSIYDVFDRRGERVDRIGLPPRSRVIGFGNGAIFVAERDDDELPHLRKYKL